MTTTQPEGGARFGWANVPRLTFVDLAAMLWAERFIVLAPYASRSRSSVSQPVGIVGLGSSTSVDGNAAVRKSAGFQ